MKIPALRSSSLTALACGLTLTLAGCQSPQARLQQQGLAEYQSGAYGQALATFNQALDQKPFDAQNNYYAGNAALKLGKLETAAYHYKLAWQADPGLADVKDALTTTYLRMGKPDQALDFLERDAELTAKVKDPRNLKKINNRRYTAQTEEAMFLNRARDRARIAETYEKLGDLDNARVYYEQAVKMGPKDPAVLIPAASFYARIGKKQRASDLFEQVYKVDPHAEGLAAAMEQAGMKVTWR
jgi:tetratricopeptide (TPR) repeat protein